MVAELDITKFRYQSIEIDIVGTGVSGGLSQGTDIENARDYPFGGLVTVKLLGVMLDTMEHHNYWNMLARRLSSCGRKILVPIPNSYFTDIKLGRAVGAVAAKVSTFSVRLPGNQPELVAGTFFAIDHLDDGAGWRVYRVKNVLSIIDEGGGNVVYEISIAPHLRRAIVDNKMLDFDNPKCLMRLTRDDVMMWKVKLPFTSRLPVSFIEASW